MNRAEIYVDYFKTFYRLADDRCRAYWGTDRVNGQAAGLESLIHFGGMLVKSPDITVVDAGAGASSAVLRTYFKNVISCDPDPEYLEQVQRACQEMGLGHGRWEPFPPQGTWDACFYDYGTKERIPNLPYFFNKTRLLFWLDDAHDDALLRAFEGVCRGAGKTAQRSAGSLDEHGRFGAFAIK